MKRLSRSLAAALVLALLAGCGQAQPGTDVNGSSSSVGQPNQSVSDGSTGGQTVPVLMGGALPFTGMESVTAENYPDGTYFYQDVTQDGQMDVFNVCQPNRITDGVDEDDYLCAAARALDGGDGDTCTAQRLDVPLDGPPGHLELPGQFRRRDLFPLEQDG